MSSRPRGNHTGAFEAKVALADLKRGKRSWSWRSGSISVSFCLGAVENALSVNEKPEIFNADEGSPVQLRGLHNAPKENIIAIAGCHVMPPPLERYAATCEEVPQCAPPPVLQRLVTLYGSVG